MLPTDPVMARQAIAEQTRLAEIKPGKSRYTVCTDAPPFPTLALYTTMLTACAYSTCTYCIGSSRLHLDHASAFWTILNGALPLLTLARLWSHGSCQAGLLLNITTSLSRRPRPRIVTLLRDGSCAIQHSFRGHPWRLSDAGVI